MDSGAPNASVSMEAMSENSGWELTSSTTPAAGSGWSDGEKGAGSEADAPPEGLPSAARRSALRASLASRLAPREVPSAGLTDCGGAVTGTPGAAGGGVGDAGCPTSSEAYAAASLSL